MRTKLPALAALAAACLSLGAAAAPGPDAVSFEINTWGKLIDSWTISADGSGQLTTAEQKPGGQFGDDTIYVQTLAPDPARYAELTAALRPARAFAGRNVPCGGRAFDLPYGHAVWRHAGAERGLDFNTGCSSSQARQVVQSLHAADLLVRKWAADAPKVEQKPAPPAPQS